jgi:hypothetical protein
MNLSIPSRINIIDENDIIIKKIPIIREKKYAIDKRYEKGKIYKIFNETDTYYGSTIATLNQRLRIHKSSKNTMAKLIINNPPYKIEIIENYPCRNKYELEQRERFFQKNNKCINIAICGRTKKEYYEDNKDKVKEQRKEYYEDNKDKINERNKEYFEKNKDKVKEQRKEYREKNNDKVKELNKKYREKNNDKIKERQKEFYEKNKDKVKEYREKNKDKLKEQRKEYREKNKDKINERQRKYRESLKF